MRTVIEQEVKFLNVNPDAIREKMLALGAKHIPLELTPYRVFDFLDNRLVKSRQLLRLRCEQGKIVLTWKKREENQGTIKRQQEIEVEVSDYEQTTKLLESMGLMVLREWEKKRESFVLNDARVDLDILPPQLNIPPFLEIEGSFEGIQRITTQLGLDSRDGKPWEGVELLKHYGLNYEKIKRATFSGISYD